MEKGFLSLKKGSKKVIKDQRSEEWIGQMMIIPGRDSWVSRVLLNWLQTEFSTHGVCRIFWGCVREKERKEASGRWKLRCVKSILFLRLSYWAWAEVSLFLSILSFFFFTLCILMLEEREREYFSRDPMFGKRDTSDQNSLLFFPFTCITHSLQQKSSSSFRYLMFVSWQMFFSSKTPTKLVVLFFSTHLSPVQAPSRLTSEVLET